MKLTSEKKKFYWDYFIVVARFSLAFVFFSYGFGKLTGGQFGVAEEELAKPLQETSLFRLAWYLFDHQPFKAVVGISQILCATLLLFNRTVLFGILMYLPISATILIIDISFMSEFMAMAFVKRFAFYYLLIALVLIHQKEKVKSIWNTIVRYERRSRLKWWHYLLVPLFSFILVWLDAVPRLIYMVIFQFEELSALFRKVLDAL